MNLLDLLLLPVMGPVKGLTFVAEQIAGEAEGMLYDEEAIKKALLELEIHLQEGQIAEGEYAQAAEQLMERLAEALRRKGYPLQPEGEEA